MPPDALGSTMKNEKGVSLAYSGQVDMNQITSALPGIDQNTNPMETRRTVSRPQTLMDHFKSVEQTQ